MDFFKYTQLDSRGVQSGLTVRKAVERLYSITLPQRGLLTGGALAGVLYQFKNGTQLTPTKDVDIFIERNLWDRISRPIRAGGAFFSDVVNQSSGQSIEVEIADRKTTIPLIANVRKQGILEFIETDVAIEKNPLQMLELFDLNCDQVALDLKTNHMHATEGFYRFLNGKEIVASRLNNIEKTCPRFCYKHARYGLPLGADVERLQNVLFLLRPNTHKIKCKTEIMEWAKSISNLAGIHAPAMFEPVTLNDEYKNALIKSGKFGLTTNNAVCVPEDFKPNENLLESWKSAYSWDDWLTALEHGKLPELPPLPAKMPQWVLDGEI